VSTATGHAPGKIILLGEHGVVYGHRAIASAVSLGTTVRLRRRAGATCMDQPWADDPRLQAALLAVLDEEGIGVQIESNLPIGRGMGSSAALAVALGRARAALQGEEASNERTDQDAWAVERVFHGSPSGIDHTVSISGGAVLYRKTASAPQITPLHLPRIPLVVIDSGSAGNTAAMVQGVKDRRPAVDPLLQEIGALVENVAPQLANADLSGLGPAMQENHALLQGIGVSNETLDAIVGICMEAGAQGAKLAGAGGGGIVIALTDDRKAVIDAAHAAGFDAREITLGSKD